MTFDEKSCGTVPFTMIDGVVHYLLINSHHNGDFGFPKGHMEKGENEYDTALRETYEETSLNVELLDSFRKEIVYTMPNGKIKSVVYFLARYENQIPAHNEGFEDNDYYLLPYDVAYNTLTHDNVREVLESFNLQLAKEL